MSFYRIFDVAASSLTAQNVRLNTIASNMANMDSVAQDEARAYRAKQVVFSSMLDQVSYPDALQGVKVQQIVDSNASVRKEYQPSHPLADGDGYIYYSNVNAVEEMANMISASRSYQNNLEVINTAKQMLLRTFTLGQ